MATGRLWEGECRRCWHPRREEKSSADIDEYLQNERRKMCKNVTVEYVGNKIRQSLYDNGPFSSITFFGGFTSAAQATGTENY